MKKTAVLLSLFAALAVSGCGEEETPAAQPIVDEVKAPPSGSTSLVALPAFAALRAACVTTPAWSILTPTTPNPTIDGSVDASGLFRSPTCASANVGALFTVQAACDGKVATAKVQIQAEVVNLVTVYAVILNAGTAGACTSLVSVTPPTIPIGGSLQFVAKVTTTCGDFLSATLPATCP